MRITNTLQSVRHLLVIPNRWDIVVFPIVLALLFWLGWGVHAIRAPFTLGDELPISLDPVNLPAYAMRTSLRMGAALLASLIFSLAYATIAARRRRAEQVLIPVLDILQSVPILGFLSITVLGFIQLFPGSMLGPEMASIFAIFTSQAWNMTFSLYHSLRMVPKELYEASGIFQLSAWQRYWKVEIPFALPQLVWNTMMSVSGGWFFVVASEAISVSGQQIMLPGIGSYIALAIAEQNLTAIGYAIVAMLVVVLITDQLLFRPLVAWSERFKYEMTVSTEAPGSWFLTLLRHTRLTRTLLAGATQLWEWSAQLFRFVPATPLFHLRWRISRREARWLDRIWGLLLVAVAALATVLLARFVLREADYAEIGQVFLLGLATAVRVVLLLVLASLVWVPIGVWIGLRPRLAQRLQPLTLFLSGFPANLLFPVVVSWIVMFHLNAEIWLSPLMILGTQWYILFNVIGAASTIPGDLRETAANLGLKGWPLWRRLLLPAVFPGYLTGGITASGGAWNASVVAEVASWGTTTLTATGLGAYIAQQTAAGDQPRVALGIAVMCLYVIAFNRLVWSRLYRLAETKLNLG